MNEEYLVIRHKDLTEIYLEEIIRLKQQYWKYPYDSQRNWIYQNLRENDIHVLLKIDGQYIAYMSINNINMLIDNVPHVGKGLGNVCVDLSYQGMGIGKKLVKKANSLIAEENCIGILLCHSDLILFYEKCGWIDIPYDNIQIGMQSFQDILMMFHFDLKYISHMVLDRVF